MADGDDAPDGAPPAPSTDRLPDDHPLVTAYRKTQEALQDANQRLKAVEDADKTELQKALDSLAEKDEALADLPKQVRRQVLRFASQATTKGFLDPEDALAFLSDDVDLDDAEQVNAALDDLAERKPHLVRKSTPARRPKPAKGERTDEPDEPAKGKERAAAALRQMRS